jgi:hypothetical protein
MAAWATQRHVSTSCGAPFFCPFQEGNEIDTVEGLVAFLTGELDRSGGNV